MRSRASSIAEASPKLTNLLCQLPSTIDTCRSAQPECFQCTGSLWELVGNYNWINVNVREEYWLSWGTCTSHHKSYLSSYKAQANLAVPPHMLESMDGSTLATITSSQHGKWPHNSDLLNRMCGSQCVSLNTADDA